MSWQEFVWEIKLRINTRLNTLGRFLNKEHRAVMPGIVLSFHDVSALFLWFWIYLLSQPVESTHTGIPKLHLPIPATLNIPPVTEGAFGHLLNRALANIALPNSRIDKSHPRADWHVRVDSKCKHWGLCYKELAIWRRLTCLSRTEQTWRFF